MRRGVSDIAFILALAALLIAAYIVTRQNPAPAAAYCPLP